MKKITLKKQNESIVYTGGTFEDIGWGAVQFPKLCKIKDGRIGLAVHDGRDDWIEQVGDSGERWLVTDDLGNPPQNRTLAKWAPFFLMVM